MPRSLLLVVLASVAFTCAAAREASACSCMSSGPACQAYWRADAVFDATVQNIRKATRDEDHGTGTSSKLTEHLVALEVRGAFKGVTTTGPLEIVTPADGAACGYDFKTGQRYLVFATRGETGDGTSHCAARRSPTTAPASPPPFSRRCPSRRPAAASSA